MWELEGTHTHLQLFQLLQDHVVRHVVKQSVCGGQDDVPKLDIEGRAVSSHRAGEGTEVKGLQPSQRHQTTSNSTSTASALHYSLGVCARERNNHPLWSFSPRMGCQESPTTGTVTANRSCSSHCTQDLQLKFPHEQSCKLICFRSVSPWKPLSRMAAQGFLLFILKM